MGLKTAIVVFFVLGLGLGVSSIYFFVGWQEDNARLKDFAAEVVGDSTLTDQDIDRLNTKVYDTQGFAKNEDYYLWKALGPTPVQILEHGGDCADKSRLLAAILGEYGVRASLVMLALCDGCDFGHTVVEAEASDGSIVVDPIYEVSFPKPGGGYYGLRDLRADPEILPGRIMQLAGERGPYSKIARYSRSDDGIHYSFPKTINLDKTAATRIVKVVLGLFVEDPELAYRPRFLEDPKLFLTLAAGGAALFSLALALILNWFGRRRRIVTTGGKPRPS